MLPDHDELQIAACGNLGVLLDELENWIFCKAKMTVVDQTVSGTLSFIVSP